MQNNNKLFHVIECHNDLCNNGFIKEICGECNGTGEGVSGKPVCCECRGFGLAKHVCEVCGGEGEVFVECEDCSWFECCKNSDIEICRKFKYKDKQR